MKEFVHNWGVLIDYVLCFVGIAIWGIGLRYRTHPPAQNQEVARIKRNINIAVGIFLFIVLIWIICLIMFG
jgi:hypothetical protein